MYLENMSAAPDHPEMILGVRFYRTVAGAEPVREWLKVLSKADRLAIGEDIKTVQFGWPLGMPLVRKLEVGLWEVRIRIRAGIARVLFTLVDDEMILLHGFVKKSHRTPKDDLSTARKRRTQMLED